MVVFGEKWLYSVKSDCIRAKKVLFCEKKAAFIQSGFNLAKVVVFRQKWLYSCKVVLFVQKWLL